jgi:hypothetical protein
MGFVHRAFVAAGVGFAVSAIVGCGSNGRLLSQSESNQLSAQLNSVQQALNDGQCRAAEDALANFENRLAGLSGVNSTLVQNLNQGASTIQALTSVRCAASTHTTPKHTHPKTTTITSSQTTTTDTNTQPTTTIDTNTEPIYTQTTSTTGGGSLTGTVSTSTTTSTSTSTSTTTPSGGQGLGAGGSTSTGTGTTGTSSGYGTQYGGGNAGDSGSGF